MVAKTKRSQKSVFEYQKPAIEAAANTRKLVIDRMIAGKVKRELTAAEQKRAKKLQGIITDLENDRHVQNRKLQTWLSADEFALIDQYWQQELTHREIYKDKPHSIKEYESRLVKADFYFNRSEHYSLNGNAVQAKKFAEMSQSEFERALERLQEIISLDLSLQMWFDRDTESRPDNDIGIDTDTIPRIVTSRSPKCRVSVGERTIRDVKLGVVQTALRNLTYETPKGSRPLIRNRPKLEDLLKLPGDDLI